MPNPGANPIVVVKNRPARLVGWGNGWDDTDNVGQSRWGVGNDNGDDSWTIESFHDPAFGSTGTFFIDGPVGGLTGVRSNPIELKAGRVYEWDVPTGAVTEYPNPAENVVWPVKGIAGPVPGPLDGLNSLIAGLPAPLNNPLVAGLAAFVVLRVLGGKKLF